jgi:DNA-binding GntR family transcriptional regulator
MIVEGDLAVGERLHDANLAATLQVSRTPIREAIKLLATEGLVDLLPGRGARVSDFSIDDIKQLFEAIAGIERSACELAAERMTDRDLEKLQRLHERMARHHASRDRRCVKQHDPTVDPRVTDDARPPRALRRARFTRTVG